MPIGLPADPVALRNHSTWFIIYGVVMCLFGLFAIAAPGVATLAVGLTVGWLLLLGGAMGIVAVISSGRSAPGFWWNLITAIVCVLAGLSLLIRPVSGVITLTIILAAYLLASGIGHIMLAIGYRKDIPNAWVWMLFSGVVDIVLGVHHHFRDAGNGDLGAGPAGRHQPADDGHRADHGRAGGTQSGDGLRAGQATVSGGASRP